MIIFSTNVKTIRSYKEGDGYNNGLEFSYSMQVINGGKATTVFSSTSKMSLKPISNKKHNNLLMSFEDYTNGGSMIIDPNFLPLNTEIKRTK